MTTVVSIANGGFAINGTPTYAGRSWKGHRIEGLLFNSRMANAIADDENPATRGAWAYADGDWDAERSTASSSPPCPPTARTACWRSASTCQGGSPQGYSWNQPWKICGFTPDGTIKPAWAARLEAVIKACDRLGMVVILGLFYGKQSGTLKDEARGEGRRHQHRRLAARARRRPTCCSRSATRSTSRTSGRIRSSPPTRCHELIELAQKRGQRKAAGQHQPDRHRRAAGRHRRQPPTSCCRTATASTGPTDTSSRARTASACRSRTGAPRRPIAASRSSTTRTTISSSTSPTTISSPPSKAARAGATSTTA